MVEKLFSEFLLKGEEDKALELCRKVSHNINPASWPVLANWFYLLKSYDEAINAWQYAFNNNPDPRFLYFQCLSVLIKGDLMKGLELHEARIDPYLKPIPKTKLWRGENIEGQKLLIYCHGGLGDSIQWLRYVPYLKKFCNVSIHLQPELHSLLEHLDVTIHSDYSLWDHVDKIIYHDSLGYTCRTDPFNVPPPLPLNIQLKPIQRRIAIMWRTESENPRIDPCIYPGKSIDLAQFTTLFDEPNTQFVVVQKIVSQEEEKLLKMYGIQRPKIETFLDTVEILKTCELAILCDTSIAHLSGSMGIPTWVLIPFLPCWRWGIFRNDSYWYPTMRLFRNNKRSNCYSVPIKKIKENLIHFI